MTDERIAQYEWSMGGIMIFQYPKILDNDVVKYINGVITRDASLSTTRRTVTIKNACLLRCNNGATEIFVEFSGRFKIKGMGVFDYDECHPNILPLRDDVTWDRVVQIVSSQTPHLTSRQVNVA